MWRCAEGPVSPSSSPVLRDGAQPGRAPSKKRKEHLALPLPSPPLRPSGGSAGIQARPARPAGHGLSSVSKPLRHKPNNKFMATSGGTGRSPLSILRDDNSPSAPAPRQGKRYVLGENLGEKKEVDLSRSLKSGNCAWSDLNKENQQCPFVEN
ncbi:cell division cycle-associated protein 3 [Geospiza fortis]|uniref:Cell division cycle-associated protein 3 n=1 Tax=Geospiza fortis TaxID=48883 RepID=A0A8N5HX18_GEOFO|nr:cell division cycle-associated protein 3 [Geospiza fortis]